MSETLFPVIEPYAVHHIPVSEIHTIYVEESGNPHGYPVLILHGGPGGSINPESRRIFNPEVYRIIAFDQRGCGKSTPAYSLVENTTADLVSDIEMIRNAFGIEEWLVFGGSWGTTLALHYAIAHSTHVSGMMLRGVFLGRQSDVDWLYQKGASDFFPDQWQGFLAPIPVEEQGDLVSAYYKRLSNDDLSIALPAARAWANWEGGIVTLIPDENWEGEEDHGLLSLARLECHYFYHHCFVEDDNYILNHADALKEIPISIVHGRYDVDCRPSGAYELHRVLPKSQLVFAQASGHAQNEPNTLKTLVRFAREFESLLG